MARRFLCCLSWWALLACALVSSAQSSAGDVGRTDPRRFDATEYGQRVILGPDWLFASGDNPAWALPDFDDRDWKMVSTEKELFEYGVRDISYAWYRMHVHLSPGAHYLMVVGQHDRDLLTARCLLHRAHDSSARVGGLSSPPYRR